jgi:tRNA-splicing ligase RtcB
MIELNINKPNKIFLEYAEDSCISQFKEAMSQPFSVKGALMPDAHTGYSLPIGGVVQTSNVVVPSWVGFDIGCGVSAIKTSFRIDEIVSNEDNIFNAIYERIPVGYNRHKEAVSIASSFENYLKAQATEEMQKIYNEKQGSLQMGTLGGGNHFIEIGYDENHRVWIIVHSGSRGVGHGCATHYMKLASPNGKASEGHYGFHVDSPEGKSYMADMVFCNEFAYTNRIVMNNLVNDAIQSCGVQGTIIHDMIVNRSHNYCDKKLVHRKGAIPAYKDDLAVIPGNMRDGSFIVTGLGNPDSLYSASHGAGRVLGRRKAKETLDVDEFIDTMRGVKAKVEAATLDESPFAYKDIFEVMRMQKDLVRTVYHIRPLINIKA